MANTKIETRHGPQMVTDSKTGLQLIVNDPSSAKSISEKGLTDLALIDWCKQFVPDDRCLVDVGAYIGTLSLRLAPHCQRVYSYEPNRTTYHSLCGTVALNNLVEKIYAYNMALGSPKQHNERHKLYIPTDDGSTSTMLETNCDRFERPTVYALDEIGLRNIGFMKIDTNGTELEVLLGSVRTIKDSQPNIIIHASREMERIVQLLTDLDYSIVRVSGCPDYYLATPSS